MFPISHPSAEVQVWGLTSSDSHSYIFLVFYGCGIDCAGVVFYSEIFPNHIRAKGVAMAIATIAITDLVYLQATATAFANIGWKFFLVSRFRSPAKSDCSPFYWQLVQKPKLISVKTGLHHHLWSRSHLGRFRAPRN